MSDENDDPAAPCERCRGTMFMRISHKLLKDESLDPADSIPMEACCRCGKAREANRDEM